MRSTARTPLTVCVGRRLWSVPARQSGAWRCHTAGMSVAWLRGGEPRGCRRLRSSVPLPEDPAVRSEGDRTFSLPR